MLSRLHSLSLKVLLFWGKTWQDNHRQNKVINRTKKWKRGKNRCVTLNSVRVLTVFCSWIHFDSRSCYAGTIRIGGIGGQEGFLFTAVALSLMHLHYRQQSATLHRAKSFQYKVLLVKSQQWAWSTYRFCFLARDVFVKVRGGWARRIKVSGMNRRAVTEIQQRDYSTANVFRPASVLTT